MALPRAIELFEDAVEMGWDEKNQGLFYGFAPNGDVCDSDKYFWVQAESIAAAALLANRTKIKIIGIGMNRIWDFSWKHMIDHKYGAWFRILDEITISMTISKVQLERRLPYNGSMLRGLKCNLGHYLK